MQMTPEAVILDPYRPYAPMLIQRLYARHGVRTICLHSTWRERLLLEGRSPVLRSAAVSAHYMVADHDWRTVARRLAMHHSIVAVLPYEEGMVRPLTIIAEELGLSWSQPQVQYAFRDKFALKALVSSNDPSIRLNTFARVSSVDDVLSVVRTHRLQRYVLKPNSGSGNQNVAFFEHDASPVEVGAYLAKVGSDVLMEEYLNGPEFWVNGQMDAKGLPTVVGIGRYYRIHDNGVENLEVGSYSVQPDDPLFAPLRDYAMSVMSATGLRRSPFHLEAIVDERGPCLVEVAARLCGELGTLLDMRHHGPQLDLIDVAAHYYVSDHDLGALPLDWAQVSRAWVATATGISSRDQRLVKVDGVEDVEESSSFLFWIKRPEAGDFVHQTQSLTTRAWAVTVRGDLQTDPRVAIDGLRSTIRLQGTGDGELQLSQKWPMYRGVAGKMWASRPRPYQARALLHPLR